MNMFDKALQFTFSSKSLAEEFCERLKRISYNVGFITVNDILRERKEPVIRGGGDYGYDRRVIRKLKAEKVKNCWQVRFPLPGKMVRDAHGYWTAENTADLEAIGKGGG